MPETHLHIISFDVPYPPDYGGVIDVFYKVKALHKAGVKVHLHCFEYGRKAHQQLNELCFRLYIYKRDIRKIHLFNTLPYIVVTRNSEELLNNLLKDEYPILFEGLHCCYYLDSPALSARRKFVRMHNIEHDYYDNLAKVERKLFKKYYFNRESVKLKKFEKKLSEAEAVIAISAADASSLASRYDNVKCITAFHPHSKVTSSPSPGNFALYHGNLSVGENNEAAIFLVQNVFNDITEHLVIAGNGASEELKSAVRNKPNIELKDHISTTGINDLISKAQLNILPTFQSTGIKLKLLNALYTGKFCLVNTDMVINTGLEELCVIRSSADELKKGVRQLMSTPFRADEIAKREKILSENFSSEKNAGRLIDLIR